MELSRSSLTNYRLKLQFTRIFFLCCLCCMLTLVIDTLPIESAGRAPCHVIGLLDAGQIIYAYKCKNETLVFRKYQDLSRTNFTEFKLPLFALPALLHQLLLKYEKNEVNKFHDGGPSKATPSAKRPGPRTETTNFGFGDSKHT